MKKTEIPVRALTLRTGAVFAATCALLLPGAGMAAVERPFPLITVSGEATLTTAPDLAQTSAGVTTQARTASEAADANSKTMAGMVEAARQAGIPDADITTARFSISPVYSQPQAQSQGRNEAPRVVGYRVSNQVMLKIRDTAKISDVLDRLITAGATDVGGISFTLSEPAKALDTVRPLAIVNAREKAELYAKAAGAQVGRVVAIEEVGSTPPVFRTMQAAAAMERQSTPPISSGESTLRVNVTVSFELLH